MRKFTKLMLTLALAFIAVGGAKAGKMYWSPSTALATWTPATNTMTWTAADYGGFHVMYTGFTPAVQNNDTEIDFSDFTKIHFTLGSVTSGATIQLRIESTGHSTKTINLAEGENNIFFSTISEDIDITKVTEMSMWATGTDDGSAVITNVYMQCVKNIVSNVFGDEITSLDGITDGSKFVISDNGTKAMYFATGDNNSKNAAVASVPADAFFYYTLDKVEDSGEAGDNIYRIKVQKADGTAFSGVASGEYLNTPNSGWSISYSGVSELEGNIYGNIRKYGTDADCFGLWYVTYDAEKGFSFQNVGKANDANGWPSWLKVDGLDGTQQYLKLYKTIDVNINSEYDKPLNTGTANGTMFTLSDATGYDAETGTMTPGGGWTFATPVDISNWDYLMITTFNTAADKTRSITITDDYGTSVTASGYDGSGSGANTGGGLYLDQWNNQNAIRINIDYLRGTKGMDISKIKSLIITNTYGGDDKVSLACVYLTNYNNTNINGGYANGDLVREYGVTGKFGTICLPYKASYAGCKVYSIASGNTSGLTLSEVSGLLEAGKPYFYMSTDEVGKDKAATVRNVNFFRADLDTYDAADPVANNGLVGTFVATTAPQGENYYVLSSNKLYQVDSEVAVGANKAYVDMSAITPSPAPELGVVTIEFNNDNTTGISAVNGSEFMVNGSDIYNLAGQRVAQPTKGLYIVNGKKVILK